MPGIWFDLEGLKVYFPYDYVYKEQVRNAWHNTHAACVPIPPSSPLKYIGCKVGHRNEDVGAAQPVRLHVHLGVYRSLQRFMRRAPC